MDREVVLLKSDLIRHNIEVVLLRSTGFTVVVYGFIKEWSY